MKKPATKKQIDFMIENGLTNNLNLTKDEASEIITEYLDSKDDFLYIQNDYNEIEDYGNNFEY